MPPIVIGGHSVAAARRAGRFADGFFPLACQGKELIELVGVVRDAAASAGRDPVGVEITVDSPRNIDDVLIHASLGVRRVVVNAPHVPMSELQTALQRRFDSVTKLIEEAML